MKNLGATIKRLRKEKKLSLPDVATHLHVDAAILSEIENGQGKLSRVLVVKLAKYFNLTEEDLLVDELEAAEMGSKTFVMKEEQVAYKTLSKVQPDGKTFVQTLIDLP